MEPGFKNKSLTLKKIILQYLKLNSHWGEWVIALISDSDSKLNNLNCILAPIIYQVRARRKRLRVCWPTACSFGWAIRSSLGGECGAHWELMQLGKLCISFTVNLPLHKLVLLSKVVVLPSHSCLFPPCATPSLGPAQPSGVAVQCNGSRTDVDFYSSFSFDSYTWKPFL